MILHFFVYNCFMKLYLIPAYKETIRNQGYGRVIKAAEKAGYTVEVLNLQIQNQNFSDVVAEGTKIISQDKSKSKAIFGFSTGALIAYKLSTQIPIEKGLFCSISPILGGDIPKNIRPYIKLFGKESVDELKKSDYGVSQAKQPLFFCGDKEGRKLIGRTKEISQLSCGQTIIIKNNEHELNSGYVKEVVKFL